MNSAGRVEFAKIPPTVPATRNTYSGRFDLNQCDTSDWSRKSNCARVAVKMFVNPADSNRLTTADPTKPA